MRARDYGIVVGEGTPGPLNAITDVGGVRIGHTTLIEGSSVRTGVTVVVPPGNVFTEPVFAGAHRLNGNGEMTGLEWVRESGMLTSPVAITNTHSVGIVRDALVGEAIADVGTAWTLPVVAETWDGVLNDINGFHVRAEHLAAALAGASGGPVAEGSVGGGTGMICHDFKGGIGTASRVVAGAADGLTVGVLVQANHGQRRRLSVNGVPVGRKFDEVPLPDWGAGPAGAGSGAGSIIVVVATDAPLLPHQCTRLAQRAGLGVARVGGLGEHSSGDLFLCFSTGNRGMTPGAIGEDPPAEFELRMLADARITSLFEAVVEATEEAIVNAMVAAETMEGRDGVVVHGLDGARLAALLEQQRER